MSDPAPNVGKMTVTLRPNGSSRPFPDIEFDPVGMFTPGLIEHYQMHFYQQIELAQARVRAAARASPPVIAVEDSSNDDTAPTPARRRAR